MREDYLENIEMQEAINGQMSTPNSLNNEIFKIDTSGVDLSTSIQSNEHSPDVTITFRNEECERKFKPSMESFFKNLLKKGETFHFITKCPSLNETENLEDSFCIDKASSSSTQRSRSFVYSSPFSTPILTQSDDTKKEQKGKKKSLTLTCFNCLGDHHLKDCPEEYDRYRIASNRKEFMDQSPSLTCRYHDDSQTSSTTGKNFVPGVISDTLRDALRLRRNELPPYIYTMRILGYPPGWLCEAEVETSGLSLFDSEIKADDLLHKNPQQPKQYDFKKFIKYPGFNTPLPTNVYDNYKRLRMPPMQPHQMLTEAMKHNSVTTTASDVYKKKKQTFQEGSSKKSKSDSSGDESSEKSAAKTESKEPSKKIESISNDPKEVPTEIEHKIKSPSTVTHLGVPVIETPNSYKSLPSYDKFSTGISEHENFENLPDAIGKYDNMRGILGNVRQKLFDKNSA